MPEPPVSSEDSSFDPVRPSDPKTGEPASTVDMRAEFARISRGVARDPDAERAFAESKIEMIRTHPTLSEADKAAAEAEVLDLLQNRSDDPRSSEGPEAGGQDG